MKKQVLSIIVFALSAFVWTACESKPAASTGNAEQSEAVAQALFTPENIQALVSADWDSVPQELLDTMGVKSLKAFKQEVKDAQCDNLQYYFGRGAAVELDGEGQLTKVTADDENAIVIHLTAESVAYGYIAFRNEADYNAFVKKTEKPADAQPAEGEEEEGMEYTADGKNTDPETSFPGFETDKWYFVSFTSNM